MLADWFKPSTPNMVGVDIGTQEVKAVLLAETAEGYELEGVARVPLPKGAVVDREIRDAGAVAAAMRQVRNEMPKSAKYGAASVSGSTVMTKVIFMDANLSDEELEAQIVIEADSLIPYPLDDVNIDFESLRTNEETNKVEILLAACRADNVDSRVDALDAAGLESRVIDVEGYALGRSFKLIADQLPTAGIGQVVGVVDLGASITTFAVVADGETVFTREQAFGGEQFTQSILAYYGMSYEEAERAKVSGELPRNYIFEVLAPFQTQLLQQIRRTMQICANSTSYENMDSLILCGGSAQIEGLASMLSTELGIPVHIADPFIGRLRANEQIQQRVGGEISRYMVACGLALRSFESWHI
ncbi:pilus assembly protein PilM [Ferrimonas lipolytica]|uniref:Pilus assembly protein PilM n=1 Tax=Ferrimonas lipolytica TaxID=2724191 RepID=A0A6H1UHI0_9GAMM|nr:pilus assembly protein PilM [Ferrimonas lipolytica]QIZ78504.1 pilus assembly protein PilM [Ferrimonas lipolytica]